MVKFCLNPDCKKSIPDTKKYCDEICLEWHIKIKREHSNFDYKFKPNPQKIIPETIKTLLLKKCRKCRKTIENKNYFVYHGKKFCNKECYMKYKQTERIKPDNDLPFMRYVQQQKEQKKEVLVYA